MPPAVDLAVVVLLCSAGRDGDEPRPDVAGRQAVFGHAVLRCPADDMAPAEQGPCRGQKAHPAADAPYAIDADLPETQHQQACERPQDLPLPARRAADRPAQSGLVRRHHLPADAQGLPLFCAHILDWFTRKVLAWRISNTLEVEFCVEALNEAIHKFGVPEIMNTGVALHVLRLDRPAEAGKDQDIDGWQSPLPRQHLH